MPYTIIARRHRVGPPVTTWTIPPWDLCTDEQAISAFFPNFARRICPVFYRYLPPPPETLTEKKNNMNMEKGEMHIVERFIMGKHGDTMRCEDGIVVTRDFAAVVDGSTSKWTPPPSRQGAPSPPSPTSGQRAMETTLEALSTLPYTATMEEAAGHLTAALRTRMTPEELAQAERRPTCSAAILSRERREVWLLGDCQCRFGGQTRTNRKAVDDILTRARCEALRYLLAHGHEEEELRRHDLGRALIGDALREQTYFQNDKNAQNPFRYTVLDGMDIDTRTVPVWQLGDTNRVVLATDGYPVVLDSLDETEAALARLLAEDPLCIGENAGTKGLMAGQVAADDRAFLMVTL